MSLKRAVVITGATSGIGHFLAIQLAKRGWLVWAGCRTERSEQELLALGIEELRPLRLDVTDARSVQSAHKKVEESAVPLMALINNAGVAFGGPIEVLSVDEVKEAFDVNFFGTLRVTQMFLPLLRRSRGRIINVSSVSGVVGIPFLVPTSSAKFALEGFSDSLRRELLPQGVSVSVIEPGLMRTPIWSKSIAASKQYTDIDPHILRHYQPGIDNLTALVQSDALYTPIERILKPVLHALESKRPRIRYSVLRHAWLVRILVWILPARALDTACRKVLRY